jgi:hypothetical protein
MNGELWIEVVVAQFRTIVLEFSVELFKPGNISGRSSLCFEAKISNL